jgi:hypothetical protein
VNPLTCWLRGNFIFGDSAAYPAYPGATPLP